MAAVATVAQWIEGARLRTLPNAVAPVLVGAGAAIGMDGFVWWRALLALVVSLALIVGVNFANDYSDGVRGTDGEDRVGPLRLVGSGAAGARSVLLAACACFALAAAAGLVLVVASTHWWLLAVGVACLAGAWFYTGGTKPYGYTGLGEPAVFLFFGLIAVLGTLYVQAGSLNWFAAGGAVAMGSFSACVLLANNLRDVATDPDSGKMTLAVRIGAANTRRLYVTLMILPFLITVSLAPGVPWTLLGLLAAGLAAPAIRTVVRGADGLSLIPVLKRTGLAMLVWGAATAVGLALG